MQCDTKAIVETLNTAVLITDNALKISTPQVDTSAVPTPLTDGPDVRSLVSGPHSYSLDHVAKTYSPYKHKKVQAKLIAEQKKELKKEHKARKKEKSLDKEQLMLPETELKNGLATSKKASVDKCKSAKISCSSNSKCSKTKEIAAQESSKVSKSVSVQKTSSTARSPRAKASTTSAATPKKLAAKKAVDSKASAAKDAQVLETKTATKRKAPTTTATKTRTATAAKTKAATATKDKTATATKAAPKSSTTVKAAREIAAETHVPEPAEGSKRAKKANEFILPTKEKAVD